MLESFKTALSKILTLFRPERSLLRHIHRHIEIEARHLWNTGKREQEPQVTYNFYHVPGTPLTTI